MSSQRSIHKKPRVGMREFQDKVHELQRTADEAGQISAPEVQKALEELNAAEEELHQQSDELASVRDQLERERRRYQDMFDFAPDAYLVTDPAGSIVEAYRA